MGLYFPQTLEEKQKREMTGLIKEKKRETERVAGEREAEVTSSEEELGESIKSVVFAVVVPGLKEHSCCIASLLFWLACGRRSCSPPRVADLTVGTCAVNTAQDCGA